MTDETVEEIKRRKLEQLQNGEATSTPDSPVSVTDEDHLNQLLADHPIVLVDCHAEWCGPCQQLKPILARIAEETQAVVATVDIDEHRNLAMEWGVRSVPTLLLYVDGERAERIMGVQPFDRLSSLIETHAT